VTNATGVTGRFAPAWLVIEGEIDVVRRDGLDHEAAITTHGAGQITGELSQLSGRPSIARGRAGVRGCVAVSFDAAHLRALVVGSAEVGEVIVIRRGGSRARGTPGCIACRVATDGQPAR
jgi:thioredoxin reductase (NADPH)